MRFINLCARGPRALKQIRMKKEKNMKSLNKILALLVVVVMVFSLAACSGTSDNTTQTNTGNNSSNGNSGNATEGGVVNNAQVSEVNTSVLRIGVDGSPATLSPNDATGNVAGFAFRTGIFDTLWYYNSHNELIYRIAESFEFNDDDTVLTVHLREDARFSNGDQVIAEDVIASIAYDNEHSGDHTRGIDIEGMRAINDTTVEIPVVREATTIEGLALVAVSSASWTENFTNEDHMYAHSMGSGPYMLDGEWASGSDMVMVRNPYYYEPEMVPFDSVELHFIAEESTRYMSLQGGELDICFLSDSSNIDSAKNSYDLYTVPVQLMMALMFDTENPNTPFANENIRLAICHAVDVPAVVEAIAGTAYMPATSMLPTSSWAYKETAYTYDPDLARQYLQAYYDETGETSFSFLCELPEDNLKKALCEAIQGYLSEVGIDMQIDSMDVGSYFPKLISGTMYCTLTQYLGSYDPGGLLNSWLGTGMLAMNHVSPEIQAKLDAACVSTASQEERTQMFYEVQDEVAAYGKCLPICEGTYNYAVANGNIDLSQTFSGDGWLTLNYIQVNG